MSEAVEEALILDIEVIEMEHKKELGEKQKEIDEKQKEIEALKLLLEGKSPAEASSKSGLSLERIDDIINS